MQYKGIDVSKYQGKIDWNKVKADGVQFAMIRAGWTNKTGGLEIDSRFKYNIESAIANKIDVGVYVYSYDQSVAAAKIAAKKLIERIKPYKLTYPVVFDMEYEEFNKTTGKTKLNTDICIAFLDEIEKAGYYSMLYCSTDFFRNYVELARLTKYDKWVAQYASENTLSAPYGIWQYSSTGKVSGIKGDCDMNWGYKDYPSMIKAKIQAATPVKPVEIPAVKPIEPLILKPIEPSAIVIPQDTSNTLYGINITAFCGVPFTKEKATEFVNVFFYENGRKGNYCRALPIGTNYFIEMQAYVKKEDADFRAQALKLLGWEATVKIM